MAIVLFILSTGRVRILVLAISPLLVTLASLAVPAATWVRLSKIFVNPEAEYAVTVDEDVRRAIESQMARTNLQKRATQLALRHPVLGVGPLMFADATDLMVKVQTGQKSGWQNPHNVYLQIAAESGIPACILLVWILIACIRLNHRSIKVCRQAGFSRERGQSFCLLLATVIFGVGMFFSNFAYGPQLPMLVGLAVANSAALEWAVRAKPIQAPEKVILYAGGRQ
jgi:O-antigen ligase